MSKIVVDSAHLKDLSLDLQRARDDSGGISDIKIPSLAGGFEDVRSQHGVNPAEEMVMLLAPGGVCLSPACPSPAAMVLGPRESAEVGLRWSQSP